MNVPWSRSFPEIERIVNRAMAKSRDDRYQTAEDMKNALAAFLATSRDLITAIYAQDTVTATRTVIEAQSLIAAGKTADAQTLLSATLKVNPQAANVRQLLGELTTVAPEPIRTMPPPGYDPTLPVRPSALAPTVVDHQTSASQRTTAPFVPAPADVKPSTPPKDSSRKWLWAGVAAAVAVAVAVAIGLPRTEQRQRRQCADRRESAGDDERGATGCSRSESGRDGRAATGPGSVEKPAEPAPAPTTAARGSAPPAPGAPAAGGTLPATATETPAAETVPTPRNAGAKSLFYGDPKLAATNGVPNVGPTGLRYRMTQASTAGSETDVDPATAVFRAGDRVRLSFESNIDGYLYVVQEGSSGRWTVMFPNPEINGGRNTIRRGEEYVVPPDGWFQFDSTVGTELLFVVLSKEPLSELPGFAKPGAKPESLNASVVESVQQSIRSRDLTFARDERRNAAGRENHPGQLRGQSRGAG